MNRDFWVLIHRWAGLAMAGFLVLVGVTGSLLAFLPELDHLANPKVYQVNSGKPLGLARLAELGLEKVPEARVDTVFYGDEGSAAWVGVSPFPGEPELGFRYLRLDPVTGDEIMRFTWGSISEGVYNVMPFIYKLHFALALDGPVGTWILGICALVWTLDCFVAFYLTLPRRRKASSPRVPLSSGKGRKRWWQRWKPAWKIRWNGGGTKLNFDLHRAGGLWLWLMLLVFAWSSVYMNLSDTVYTPVISAVTEYRAPWTELTPRDEPLQTPSLDWRQAEAIGERLMAEQAAAHGFSIERPKSLRLDRAHGVYVYNVRSSRDVHDKRGQTQVFFDADTGELKLLLLPTGQYGGNTITTWLFALHEAAVFGLPYRIFVCLLGLTIVMLSVTGVIIWWKKRRARRAKARVIAARRAGSAVPSKGEIC